MRTKKIMIATLFSMPLLINNISLANPVAAAKNCDDLLLQDQLATAELFSCTQKAAKQGDAKAQYDLGVRQDKGRGAKKDEAQTFNWYQKTAEQGLNIIAFS